MSKRILRGVLAGVAVLVFGAWSDASAQMPPYPVFSSSVDTTTSYVYTDNQNADDTQEASATIEPTMTLEWWNNAFISTTFNITDYQPAGRDSFFEHEDATISDVQIFLTDWVWFLQAGKTDVPFGLAGSNAPGLFGGDMIDYGYGGRIMALGAYDFGHVLADGLWGGHVVEAGSFFVDTTFMSASAFGQVERTRLGDGGPGNTEGFDSYFVTYDATNVPLFSPGGFNYRASYIYNAAGRGDTGHEEGWSLGTVVPIPLAGQDALSTSRGEYLAANVLLEYAEIDNFGGVGGVDNAYLTAGFEVFRGQWFATATTTRRQSDNPFTGDSTDHLYAASAGYVFNNAMQVQAGYAYQEIANADVHQFGVAFTYNFDITDIQSWWPSFGKPAYVLTNAELH